METHPHEGPENLEDRYARDVPEDVAVLYSWANLEGAKYRDFSANRREHRAQMRQRAAEQVRAKELQAQAEAEAAAMEAERASAAAHARADAATASLMAKPVAAGSPESLDMLVEPFQQEDRDREVKQSSIRLAAREARRASVEREAAAGRAKAAALAAAQAQREEQEISEARALAARQAARYAEASQNPRSDTDARFDSQFAKSTSDPSPSRRPDEDERTIAPIARDKPEELKDTLWGSSRLDELQEDTEAATATSTSARKAWAPAGSIEEDTSVEPRRRKAESRAEVVQQIPGSKNALHSVTGRSASPLRPVEETSSFEDTAHAMTELFEVEPVAAWPLSSSDQVTSLAQRATPLTAGNGFPQGLPQNRVVSETPSQTDALGPAWLYPRPQVPPSHPSPASLISASEIPEPLERAQERTATRWFALRGVFARHDADRSSERQVAKLNTRQAPIAAVFSIAGGVGKTSLVATLGRALSFLGERVLLSDTTSHGLLPFYFGASQLVSGVVRTFSPPAGSSDAPIHLVSYDAGRDSDEPEGQAGIVDDLLENSQRANRVIIDLSANRAKMIARLGKFKPTVLVPLLPDMNSVISIESVEKIFSYVLDEEGRPLQPVYFLNQFDAALPLHLDIREVLKQQLGDRLLPFVIRRSVAVGEALAEGMTVVDYDPGSMVTEDFLRVANWLRSVSAPVAISFRHQRWSEQ